MKRVPPTCPECSLKMKWGKTEMTFPHDEEGFVVTVAQIPAWVCPQCGEASFDPDVAQKVLDTARELAVIARKARTGKPKLKELVIKVA